MDKSIQGALAPKITKPRIDMTGKRFDRLVVVGYKAAGTWYCQCDCGNATAAQGHHLRSGNTKSCGCYRNEFSEIHVTTHGQSKTSTYHSWNAMRNRCSNSKSESYHRYGGRGIKVCDRWLNSFENFLSDMGECPPGLTIDRCDNDGNYEPSNCKWATYTEQALNRSSSLANRKCLHGVASSAPCAQCEQEIEATTC